MAFYVGATDVDTGEVRFHRCEDGGERDMLWLRASASMPIVSRAVEVDGLRLLDGGIADAVPYRFMLDAGYDRNVIVLTQAAGYQKQPNRAMPLVRLRYRKYPAFVEASRVRHEVYNRQLALAEAEARAGRAFILRPDAPPDVGRVEKDPEKLRALHAAGYAVARRELDRLKAFLEE